MKFEQLKIGAIIKCKKTGVEFQVVTFVSDNVVEVNNMKYIGMNDYVNTNTIDEYELVSQ